MLAQILLYMRLHCVKKISQSNGTLPGYYYRASMPYLSRRKCSWKLSVCSLRVQRLHQVHSPELLLLESGSNNCEVCGEAYLFEKVCDDTDDTSDYCTSCIGVARMLLGYGMDTIGALIVNAVYQVSMVISAVTRFLGSILLEIKLCFIIFTKVLIFLIPIGLVPMLTLGQTFLVLLSYFSVHSDSHVVLKILNEFCIPPALMHNSPIAACHVFDNKSV